MTWDAFISYSHSADRRMAPALQSGLQRFLRPWYRPAGLRIFRDETGLQVDPRLWSSIVERLDNSRYFILLAAPEAAQSLWVNREVEYWLQHRQIDHLLLVVTGGELQWNAASDDFDWNQTTALPPSLKGAFDEEPLYLDLRWATPQSVTLDLGNPKFLEAIAWIAAPLHGKSKDDLIGEDVTLRRRARRLATAAIVTLTSLTVMATALAWYAQTQRIKAEKQRVKAEAQKLAVQSGQFAAQPDLGFLLAGQAYRLLPDTETTGALYSALHTVPELVRLGGGHTAAVQSLAIIPELDLIVSGDFDGEVLVTSRQTGTVVLRHEHPSRAAVLCLRPDASRQRLLVVSTLSRYWLSLKDFTLQSEHVFNDGGWGRTCDLDPVHQRMVLARQDGQVELANTDTDHGILLRPGGSEAFSPALAFNPGGTRVAMSDAGGGLTVRDLQTGKNVWTASLPAKVQVLSLSYNQDGSILAGGDNQGWVRTWNGKTGQPEQARPAQAGPVWQVGFTRGHPAGEYLAAAGSSGEINWFEVKSFLPTPPTRIHNSRINALAFGSDGTYASASNDKTVAYFNPLVSSHRDRNIGAPITDLTSSADGSKIAVVAGANGSLGFYAISTLEPVGGTFATGTTVLTVALSPQADKIALGSADGQLSLLQDFAPHAPPIWIKAHGGALLKAVFAPDGNKLYTLGEDGRLIVWSVGTDRVATPRTLSTEAFRSFAVNSAGTLLAAGSLRGGIMIIDTGSGKAVVQIDRNPALAVTAIAYHPRQPQLLIGDAYGYLHMFNTDTKQFVGEPQKGQQGEITGIATVPLDGSVYTSSRDGTLRHWNTNYGGQPVGIPMAGTRGAIRALTIDGSGKLLVSGGADGRLTVWQIDTESWLREGCERFGRRFTTEERRRFGLEETWPEPCAPE